MARSQKIKHLVFFGNGIHNKYNGGCKPVVFGKCFNSFLDNIAAGKEVCKRKHRQAEKDNSLSCHKQFIEKREFFLCFQEFAEKNKIEKDPCTLNHKIEIAFKVVVE